MKIIDLLNKIANGEEVPKKIRINGYIYEYQEDDYVFIDKNNDNHEYWLFSDGYTDKFEWLDSALNTEVKILEEEKKIPERISNAEVFDVPKLNNMELSNIALTNKEDIKIIKDTLNEVLDYLKSKGE